MKDVYNKRPPKGGLLIVVMIEGRYIALMTLSDFKQFVQTLILLTTPFTLARTRCRFGSQRRRVL